MAEDRVIEAVREEGKATRDLIRDKATTERERDQRIAARASTRLDEVEAALTAAGITDAKVLREVKALRDELTTEENPS